MRETEVLRMIHEVYCLMQVQLLIFDHQARFPEEGFEDLV